MYYTPTLDSRFFVLITIQTTTESLQTSYQYYRINHYYTITHTGLTSTIAIAEFQERVLVILWDSLQALLGIEEAANSLVGSVTSAVPTTTFARPPPRAPSLATCLAAIKKQLL